jgi:hypothetical protein
MVELLGAVVRGILALLGHVIPMLDLAELRERKLRRKRKAALEDGQRVRIPGVLTDPDLTGDREREGVLAVGGGPVTWRAKKETEWAEFSPGPLTMAAVDEMAITFQSGRTELRLHPDEAPLVLRALDR